MFTHLKQLLNHNTAYQAEHSEDNMKTKKMTDFETCTMIYIFYIWCGSNVQPTCTLYKWDYLAEITLPLHKWHHLFPYWFKLTHVHTNRIERNRNMCILSKNIKIFTQCANNQYHAVSSWYCFFPTVLKWMIPESHNIRKWLCCLPA